MGQSIIQALKNEEIKKNKDKFKNKVFNHFRKDPLNNKESITAEERELLRLE